MHLVGLNQEAAATVASSPPRPRQLAAIFAALAVAAGILAGGFVVYLNKPTYILLACAAVVVFLLSLYSKEFGILALVFISYTRLSDVLIEYHGFISIAKPFIAVLVITILLRWVVYADRPKGWEKPAVLLALLSLTGLFSLFYSPVPDRVWARWLDDVKDILIALIAVILLQKGPTFRRVIWTFIVTGMFLGTLTVVQYFLGTFENAYGGFAVSQMHQIIGTIDDYRSTGPIGDPNFFAQILVVLIPISLERVFHEKRLVLRLVALWCFAACSLAVLFTYSRGGLIALVAALVMLLLFYPPRGFQIPIVILSLIIFAALLPPNYIDRLAELKDLIQPRGTLRIEERSLQGRLSENLTALEMIKSNPLFGVGLSSYNYMFPIYSKKLGLALVATEREAHNLYLEVAAETGIIGLSVLLLVLFYSFQSIVKAKKIFKRAKLKDYEGMVTGFMAGWVGYLAAAMYIHNAFPRYFYLLVGISLALHGIAKNTMPGLLVSEDAQ